MHSSDGPDTHACIICQARQSCMPVQFLREALRRTAWMHGPTSPLLHGLRQLLLLLQFSEDPDAYGMKALANPPPLRTSSGLSSMDSYTSEDSTSSSEADGDETVSYLGSRQGFACMQLANARRSASHICTAPVPAAQAGPALMLLPVLCS